METYIWVHRNDGEGDSILAREKECLVSYEEQIGFCRFTSRRSSLFPSSYRLHPPIDSLQMESLNSSLVDILEDFASSLRSQLPLSSTSLVADPPTQLINLSNLGTLDYSFFDIYTCDIFTLLLFFLIAVAVKLLIVFGLNKQAVGRVQVSLGEKYGHEVETEVARNVLKKHLVAV